MIKHTCCKFFRRALKLSILSSLLLPFFIGQGLAIPISGLGQISFSSATGVDSVVSGSLDATVDGILDNPGINPPFNGVSLDTFPLSITYNFDIAYDLTSFFLLSEVGTNSISNALRGFELTFFDNVDASGSQVGGLFSGTQTNPSSLQEFDISGSGFLNIRSFTLSVLSVNGTNQGIFIPGRVKFSEVQFSGNISPVLEPDPVDEPGSIALILFGALALRIAKKRKKKKIIKQPAFISSTYSRRWNKIWRAIHGEAT